MGKLLEFRNISKSFQGNAVLKDVSFSLNQGEIVGLVGENGAGKSTMMNILFGMDFIKATGGYDGEIIFNGKTIDFSSPDDALNTGIGMVHQEFSLLPGFTVAENILLNREITKPNFSSRVLDPKLETLDNEKINKKAKDAISNLKVDINEKSYVKDLSVGHKQFIEIARELSRENVKLIILDEPTAVLTEKEASVLLGGLKMLARKGISIIFISHRLQEIKELCDKIIVLRDGVIVKELDNKDKDTDVKQIANLMVGRDINTLPINNNQNKNHNDKNIMEIRNLSVRMPGEIVSDVNLDIKEGEILGIAGLAGQGKLGISNGVMGIFPSRGDVTFKGNKLNLEDTTNTLKNKIAFVSEDRKGVGLLLEESLDWNISFQAMQIQDKFLKKIGPFKFRDEGSMKSSTEKYIDELNIKTQGPSEKAKNLSGGNQQKICLAKAFELEPELLFVNEPTRGIDIGAKHLVLEALRNRNVNYNTTIVITSSELEELRSVADRIAIVFEGKIIGILNPNDSLENFGLLMAGQKDEEIV